MSASPLSGGLSARIISKRFKSLPGRKPYFHVRLQTNSRFQPIVSGGCSMLLRPYSCALSLVAPVAAQVTAAAMLLAASCAYGQVAARVTGAVVDASGAAIAGAHIGLQLPGSTANLYSTVT